MRYATLVLAALLCCVLCGNVVAADVPSSTLSQMGINNMVVVSDADGMEVRGKGFMLAGIVYSRSVQATDRAIVWPGIPVVLDRASSDTAGIGVIGLQNNQIAGELAVTQSGNTAFAGTVVGNASVFLP